MLHLPRDHAHVQYFPLLYEAMQDESAELCFIFRGARSVLYFPSTRNTAPYTLQ